MQSYPRNPAAHVCPPSHQGQNTVFRAGFYETVEKVFYDYQQTVAPQKRS